MKVYEDQMLVAISYNDTNCNKYSYCTILFHTDVKICKSFACECFNQSRIIEYLLFSAKNIRFDISLQSVTSNNSGLCSKTETVYTMFNKLVHGRIGNQMQYLSLLLMLLYARQI